MLDKIKKITAASLDMPEEILYKLPIATVVDNSKITLQNYKALREYTDSEIKIRLKKSTMLIIGDNLHIVRITDDFAEIRGSITKILYGRGEKNE